jgi:hypothetical protein
VAKPALANGCPMTMEELVEDVIRSINGIRTSTPETARLHPAIPTALFFALAYCLIYAAINSVDVVESSVLDGVETVTLRSPGRAFYDLAITRRWTLTCNG